MATSSARIIQGSNTSKYKINYIVDFKRNIFENKTENPTHCRICEHELKEDHEGLCPYCNNMILPVNYNWIMTRKKIIFEEKL